jgi:hypothetical protein
MNTTKVQLAGLILLAGILMSVARPALAGDDGSWSGTSLFDYCREGSLNAEICTGYIVGVVEATPAQICYPPGATYFQMIQVVGRFLVVHPEQLHLHALDLVLLALHEAFPCKQF